MDISNNDGISPGWGAEAFEHLAENVKDDIREILEYHINGVNNEDNEKH